MEEILLPKLDHDYNMRIADVTITIINVEQTDS